MVIFVRAYNPNLNICGGQWNGIRFTRMPSSIQSLNQYSSIGNTFLPIWEGICHFCKSREFKLPGRSALLIYNIGSDADALELETVATIMWVCAFAHLSVLLHICIRSIECGMGIPSQRGMEMPN
mmetsp:Transcript_104053/g.190587  ORF Transcript_104053/g.190587 Transcript_104053/m.190587 type:complete len:125 (+) Transcript_104053:625-999(+)